MTRQEHGNRRLRRILPSENVSCPTKSRILGDATSGLGSRAKHAGRCRCDGRLFSGVGSAALGLADARSVMTAATPIYVSESDATFSDDPFEADPEDGSAFDASLDVDSESLLPESLLPFSVDAPLPSLGLPPLELL